MLVGNASQCVMLALLKWVPRPDGGYVLPRLVARACELLPSLGKNGSPNLLEVERADWWLPHDGELMTNHG